MEKENCIRCDWANRSEPEKRYHDQEWGRPLHDDRKLFELFLLEGMQAGLSWSTILRKRESFRLAFDHFDPAVIAGYDSVKVEELLQNKDIIRNRLKIEAAVKNANTYFKVLEQYGSFNDFFWRYVDYSPMQNHWTEVSQVPARTELSDQISRDLKKQGFKFAGSVIVYSFMQSIGMVNDHLSYCFLYHDQSK